MEGASYIDAGGCHSWFPSWYGSNIDVAFGADGFIDFFHDLMCRTMLGAIAEEKSKS